MKCEYVGCVGEAEATARMYCPVSYCMQVTERHVCNHHYTRTPVKALCAAHAAKKEERPMINVGWVVNLISAMSQVPALRPHALTLVGPRLRGSTTKHGLEILPSDRRLEEMEVADYVRQGGCRYFDLFAPELQGEVKVVAYQYIAPACVKERVKERVGSHGPELYIDRAEPEMPVARAHNVTVILGPPREYEGFPHGVVYTWHPGSPLAPFDGKNRQDWTAVKLHNG